MTSIRVAALQMRSGQDVKRNADEFEALVREAAAQGATYIQSPEMTGTLMPNRTALMAVLESQENDLIVKTASRLAADLGVFIHIGSTAIARGDGKIANRAFLFGPDGGLIATYDKIHMFDVDLDNGERWRESATYEPGTISVIADLPFARLGLSICYDLRFPQLYRAQALAGAQILSVPAAFTRQTGEAHWHVLLRARAIENGAFVIAAAQGGSHESGRETFGHSLIVDPWGRVLAEANHDEPAVIITDIDLDAVTQARMKIPNLKNVREFNIEHAGMRIKAPAQAIS